MPDLAVDSSNAGLPVVPDQEAPTDEALYPNQSRTDRIDGDSRCRRGLAGDSRHGDSMNPALVNFIEALEAASPEAVRRFIRGLADGIDSDSLTDTAEADEQALGAEAVARFKAVADRALSEEVTL